MTVRSDDTGDPVVHAVLGGAVNHVAERHLWTLRESAVEHLAMPSSSPDPWLVTPGLPLSGGPPHAIAFEAVDPQGCAIVSMDGDVERFRTPPLPHCDFVGLGRVVATETGEVRFVLRSLGVGDARVDWYEALELREFVWRRFDVPAESHRTEEGSPPIPRFVPNADEWCWTAFTSSEGLRRTCWAPVSGDSRTEIIPGPIDAALVALTAGPDGRHFALDRAGRCWVQSSAASGAEWRNLGTVPFSEGAAHLVASETALWVFWWRTERHPVVGFAKNWGASIARVDLESATVSEVYEHRAEDMMPGPAFLFPDGFMIELPGGDLFLALRAFSDPPFAHAIVTLRCDERVSCVRGELTAAEPPRVP